jgi:signal-transduction protein with cAMP-binding, CBS, and nucleotidyltransferase domain
MNALQVLKSTPFFAEVLDEREFTMLADRARSVAFGEGEALMSEEGPGHSMFVIVSGEAKVSVSDEAEPVAKLGPGAIVGEMSLLTGAPRNATVTATKPVEAIEVDKDALANVLWMSSTLVGRFVEMLFRRQRELERVHGGEAWGMMRPGKAELANQIRLFFERTGDAAAATGQDDAAGVAAVDAAIAADVTTEPKT